MNHMVDACPSCRMIGYYRFIFTKLGTLKMKLSQARGISVGIREVSGIYFPFTQTLEYKWLGSEWLQDTVDLT